MITSSVNQLASFGTYWEGVGQTRWGNYITEIEKKAILMANGIVQMVDSLPYTAIEIGCEGGRWTKMLADLGWKMFSTETNASVLAICQKRVPSAICFNVNANDQTLPFENEHASLLLCIEVPQVIQSSWFSSECCRVLKANGLVVGVFWNFLSIRGVYAHLRSTLTGSYDYYKFTYAKWRKMMILRGFQFIHEEGCCWFPFSRSSESRLVPILTSMEKYVGLRKFVSLSPWVVFVARKIV